MFFMIYEHQPSVGLNILWSKDFSNFICLAKTCNFRFCFDFTSYVGLTNIAVKKSTDSAVHYCSVFKYSKIVAWIIFVIRRLLILHLSDLNKVLESD
jgi:hypothetical protein